MAVLLSHSQEQLYVVVAHFVCVCVCEGSTVYGYSNGRFFTAQQSSGTFCSENQNTTHCNVGVSGDEVHVFVSFTLNTQKKPNISESETNKAALSAVPY